MMLEVEPEEQIDDVAARLWVAKLHHPYCTVWCKFNELVMLAFDSDSTNDIIRRYKSMVNDKTYADTRNQYANTQHAVGVE